MSFKSLKNLYDLPQKFGEDAKEGVVLIYMKGYTGERIDLGGEDGSNDDSSAISGTETTFAPNVETNGKKPLYILNGKILETGADADTPIEVKNLDPNLISEINVLKDKAAIEEYGKKGANGVIIIKTKDFVEEKER